MIVVADTSPLNYLILLDQIDILHVLYGRILVPHAVLDELLSAEAPSAVRRWATNPPQWLELLSPSTNRIANIPKLDRGETEAIALAEELNADWLLIDELAGRKEALNRGIPTVGTLGILLEGHRMGTLDFSSSLKQLSSLGFHVSQSLTQQMLLSLEKS
jgi:predicted nucleic acid-binding protein